MSNDDLGTTEMLFGEVIALRIVLQRLLGQLAAQSGHFDAVMQLEHAAALDDLTRMKIANDRPGRGELIRMHAERVIDEMHSVMSQGRPPTS